MWVKPSLSRNKFSDTNKKVLIIDLGTCSVRAGLYSSEASLPQIFMPNICSRDINNKTYKVGFDVFQAQSDGVRKNEQLIFPLKSKNAVDKLGLDIVCIEAVIENIIKRLNINNEDYEVLLITPHKYGDKVNIQFLNLFLDKLSFASLTLLTQSLLVLYAYNCNTGVIVNLGEKIDILPISNGITFQSGVTNLAYGGSTMSEYLNSYVSRAHYNYVNDAEQYLVRFIKEKACYVANNYAEELKKPRNSVKFSINLNEYDFAIKNCELESSRFEAPEGLFNPEIWGMDGQGIHKLIQKAIQSCSMDLRREMAKSIYLAGGMTKIPGLVERLQKELKALLPPSLNVKVNCSPHSYHSAYLGAFKFIQQPEYNKLLITKKEWSIENVNCLRKLRLI